MASYPCTGSSFCKCSRCATRKAAATRASNRANGILSKSAQYKRARRAARGQTSSPRSTPIYGVPPTSRKTPFYTAPVLDARSLALHALAALEDALVGKSALHAPTADTEAAFVKYQKIKAHAMSASANQNEANVALRLALLELTKLVF